MKMIRTLATAAALTFASLTPAISLASDEYCKELLSSKVEMQQLVNHYRTKMREARTPQAREFFMNKFEYAYTQHGIVDSMFTRDCR